MSRDHGFEGGSIGDISPLHNTDVVQRPIHLSINIITCITRIRLDISNCFSNPWFQIVLFLDWLHI